MPRPSITTTTEVEIKPKLAEQLKRKLEDMRGLKREGKNTDARINGGEIRDAAGNLIEEVPGIKSEIETLFLEAGEEEALDAGVRVATSFGEVPIKMIRPEPSKGSLNEKKMLATFYVKRGKEFVGISVKDLDKCRNKPSEKKPYLGVYLPKEAGDDE